MAFSGTISMQHFMHIRQQLHVGLKTGKKKHTDMTPQAFFPYKVQKLGKKKRM
jgi:hypothetical protein